MTRPWRGWTSWVLVLALAAGCDDDAPARSDGAQEPQDAAEGDVPQGDGDAARGDAEADLPAQPRSPQEQAALYLRVVCEDLPARLCEQLEACGCLGGLPGIDLQDRQACVQSLASRCQEGAEPVAQALRRGAVRLEEASLMACVEDTLAISARCSFEQDVVVTNTCRRAFSTSPALGDACEEPICADGQGYCSFQTAEPRCEPLPGLGEACEFVCAEGGCLPDAQGLTRCEAPRGQGAGCDQSQQCARGFRCVEGRCAPPRGQGEACGWTDECALGLRCNEGRCGQPQGQCLGVEDCGQGYRCFGEATRTCALPSGLGAQCESSEDCAQGLWCDAGRCAQGGARGEPCGEGVVCQGGLACSLEAGLCGAIPGQGEACGLDQRGPVVCGEGLGCIEGVCGLIPGEGDTCTIDNRCADGLGCDFTPQGSLCAPRRGADQACMNDQICAAGLYCDFGTGRCQPWEAPGASCSDGNECGPEATCAPGEGGFVCQALPSAGESCFLDCAAGLRCRTTAIVSACAPALCAAAAP